MTSLKLAKEKSVLENPAKVLVQQVEGRLQRLEAFSAAMSGAQWTSENQIPKKLVGSWKKVQDEGVTPMQKFQQASAPPAGKKPSPGATPAPAADPDPPASGAGDLNLDDCGALGPAIKGFRVLSANPDFKIDEFLESGAAFLKILEALGASMKLGRVDFANNVKKTEDWYKKDKAKNGTFRAFLENEKATNIHKPGGKIKDPSGAVGTLWMRRSFEFVAAILKRLLNDEPMKEAAFGGYEDSIKNFHGTLLKGTFGVALKAVPSKEGFMDALQLNEDSFTKAAQELVDQMGKTCSQMKAISEELDLEDTRKV